MSTYRINRSGVYPSHCRHCGRRKVIRPRGLCWTCYYAPGVRDRYPTASKYAKGGVAGANVAEKPLPVPTMTMPGSPERAAVMAARAARGESLWHPDDATAVTALRVTDAERN